MNRIPLIGLICSALLCCGPKASQIERFIEDGVEVVVNRLEPYVIPGEPTELELEALFVIDGENENLAAAGLGDISFFDVDSRGNIYLGQTPRDDAPLLFKFDARGRFIQSFGTLGQGPGEILHPDYLSINPADELTIMNRGSRRIMFFDTAGGLRREIPFDLFYFPRYGLMMLSNGNLLAQIVGLTENREPDRVEIRILDPGLKELNPVFDYVHPLSKDSGNINIFVDMPVIATSREYILLGFEAFGPDIRVYDLGGNLIRKIQREVRPVKTPAGTLDKVRDLFPENYQERDRLYAPPRFPAHQHMFCDDKGRLYVMTPEKDPESGRHIYDIFNRDGLFIARKDLGWYDRLLDLLHDQRLDVKARNGRLYGLREKDSGFKQLIVSGMVWR